MKWRSEWHRPAATVRMSTSWGPGELTSTSSISSFPGICRSRAARMAASSHSRLTWRLRSCTSAQSALAGMLPGDPDKRPVSRRAQEPSCPPRPTSNEEPPWIASRCSSSSATASRTSSRSMPSGISEGQSFADDLEADSLALIELVEALEEELSERSVGFRIDDEDLEDLKTVRDAVDYVVGRL